MASVNEEQMPNYTMTEMQGFLGKVTKREREKGTNGSQGSLKLFSSLVYTGRGPSRLTERDGRSSASRTR